MDKRYPCQFCSKELPSKSARKTHNKKCLRNFDRAKNQARTAAVARKERSFSGMDADLFSDIFSDLPDGAFFAMAEEHGLSPEDFI